MSSPQYHAAVFYEYQDLYTPLEWGSTGTQIATLLIFINARDVRGDKLLQVILV